MTDVSRETLDAVYNERNNLAIALARLVLAQGTPFDDSTAGYAFDPATGRACVYVEIGGNQLSWHMSDRITEEWRKPGANKPLPLFKGVWDGTFKGREADWPTKYIDGGAEYGVMRAAFIAEEPQSESDEFETNLKAGIIKIGSAVVALGLDCAPKGATHYRICANGQRRHYHRDLVTGWHFHHTPSDQWYPTDLSPDYLESHVQLIEPSQIETAGSSLAGEILDQLAECISETTLATELTQCSVNKHRVISRGSMSTLMRQWAPVQQASHAHVSEESQSTITLYRVVNYPDHAAVQHLGVSGWTDSAVNADWVNRNCCLLVR